MATSPAAAPTPPASDGQQRLSNAVDAFTKALFPAEQAKLNQSATPGASEVAAFVTELNNNTNLKRKRVGNQIEPFLQFVSNLGAVTGVYVQGDPNQLAQLVWGSAKLVVQLAATYFEYFTKITELFVKIGHLCPLMKEISELFETSDKLQNAIFEFYGIIVEFCLQVLLFLRKSVKKQFFKSVWKPFKTEFKEVEKQLEDQRQIIDDFFLVASEKSAKQSRQIAVIYQKDGYQHRKFEVEQWAKNREWQLQQDLATKRKTFKKILSKISDYDHTRVFLNSRDRRHPDTGNWMFKLPEYQDWKASTSSEVLWCHGIPGSGKTLLASSVIENIFGDSNLSQATILYFFCDYQTQESLAYRTILSCFLRQLVILREPLPSDLQDRLKSSFLEGTFRPTISDLETFIIECIGTLNKLFIIVDGIDECSDQDRADLLSCFARLMKVTKTPLKIALSSRPEIDIPRILGISRQISLSSIADRPELQAYIAQKLEQRCHNLQFHTKELQDDISKALLQEAGGMFLWVHFQIEDISALGSEAEIRNHLKSLPKGLEKTYDRILEKIKRFRNEAEALLVFKWLLSARRPLTLAELSEAVAIRKEDTHHAEILERYNRDPLGLVFTCNNLIVVNEMDKTVQFAHSTIAEYIRQTLPQIYPSAGDMLSRNFLQDSSITACEIGHLLITYLSLSDFETQISKVEKKSQGISVIPRGMLLPGLLPKYLKPLSAIIGYVTDFNAPHKDNNFEVGPSGNSLLYGGRKEQKPIDELSKNFILLPYATENWLYHFRNASTDHDIREVNRMVKLVLPFEHVPWRKDLISQITSRDYWRDALNWACKHDNLGIFQAAALDQSIHDYSTIIYVYGGLPPLHIAAKHGSLAVFLHLLSSQVFTKSFNPIASNAPIDYRFRPELWYLDGRIFVSPLVLAILGEHKEIIKEIFRWKKESDASPYACQSPSDRVMPPMVAAMMTKNISIIQQVCTGLKETDAAEFATTVTGSKSRKLEVLSKFHHTGLRTVETVSRTPSELAAELGDLDVFKCLAQNGAPMHLKPLCFVVVSTQGVGKYLEAIRGISTSTDPKPLLPHSTVSHNALESAALAGNIELVDFILNNHEQLNCTNFTGMCISAIDALIDVVRELNKSREGRRPDEKTMFAATKKLDEVFLEARGRNKQFGRVTVLDALITMISRALVPGTLSMLSRTCENCGTYQNKTAESYINLWKKQPHYMGSHLPSIPLIDVYFHTSEKELALRIWKHLKALNFEKNEGKSWAYEKERSFQDEYKWALYEVASARYQKYQGILEDEGVIGT